MSCFIAKSKHIIQKIAHSTNFQENIIGKSQDIIERLYMRITNIECGIQVSSPLFLFDSSILCQKTKRTCPDLLKFIHHLRIPIFLEIRSPNFALSCSLYNNVPMLRHRNFIYDILNQFQIISKYYSINIIDRYIIILSLNITVHGNWIMLDIYLLHFTFENSFQKIGSFYFVTKTLIMRNTIDGIGYCDSTKTYLFLLLFTFHLNNISTFPI